MIPNIYSQVSYGPSPIDSFIKGHKAGAEVYDRDSIFAIGKAALEGGLGAAQNEAFARGQFDKGLELDKYQMVKADKAREQEGKLAAEAAGIFQNFIDKAPDDQRAAMTQKFVAAHPVLGPRLQRFGVNVADPAAVSQFFQAQAKGYVNPLDEEKQRLGIEATRSQIAGQGLQQRLTAAQLEQIKTQSPEWRMANAERFGIAKDTPAWQTFVVNGQLPQPQGMKFQVVPEGGSVLAEDPRTGSARMIHQGAPKVDATTKKAIDEADDFVAQTHAALGALVEAERLNAEAYSGAGASQRATVANNVTPWRTPGAVATKNFENVIMGQALQSLRATFGGNPTEGERKILLEVAGSVNETAEVRADILRRAKQMAEQRLAINQQKAQALRAGAYYGPGGQPAAVNAPMNFAPGARQPAPSAPQASPSVQPGQAYSWQGQNWRYKGGDPARPESWEPSAPTGR
jgi:hypothetical protein